MSLNNVLGIMGVLACVYVVYSAPYYTADHPSSHTCSPAVIKCQCGKRGLKNYVEVPVRRRKKFDGYRAYCEDPPKMRSRHHRNKVCGRRFLQCLTCDLKGCVTCPDNKYGFGCRKDCSSLCENGGTCRNTSCICPLGYSGARCQQTPRKECTVVTKPIYGDVKVIDRTAIFTCLPGYNLIGHNSSKCDDDGTWSTEAPTCKGLCPLLNDTEHMSFTEPGVIDDEEELTVIAECNEGYRLQGRRKLQCKADGTWSPLPRCVKRGRCHVPHEVDNGIFESSDYGDVYYEGTDVTYECDEGFVMIGNFSIICEENGAWDNGPPRCEPEKSAIVNCSSPVEPDHGSFSYGPESKTKHIVPGVRVVYSCNEAAGYFLHPNTPNYYCTLDGTWSPAVPPTCIKVKTCGDPGSPANGRRCIGYHCAKQPSEFTSHMCAHSRATTGDGNVTLPEGRYVEGTRVEYKCNKMYWLYGNHFTSCRDGDWNNQPPICVPECGTRSSNIKGYVYQGEVALAQGWPWHVVLSISDKECGGALLGDEWVVTAAHCVTNKEENPIKANHIKAWFGRQEIGGNSTNKNLQFRKVSTVYPHPEYSADNTLDYDIALLKLSEPVSVTAHVKPICVTNKTFTHTCPRIVHQPNGSNQNRQSCKYIPYNKNTATISEQLDSFISGFGRVSEHVESYSNVLMSGRVLIETNQTECSRLLQNHNANLEVTERMICAGGTISHPCAGDSGSPLVTYHPGIYKWYLQGIVSGGPKMPCRKNNAYGVFSYVPKFYQWMNTHVPNLKLYRSARH